MVDGDRFTKFHRKVYTFTTSYHSNASKIYVSSGIDGAHVLASGIVYVNRFSLLLSSTFLSPNLPSLINKISGEKNLSKEDIDKENSMKGL